MFLRAHFFIFCSILEVYHRLHHLPYGFSVLSKHKEICMGLSTNRLRDFLDEKVLQYNTPNFIDNDPVQVPHMYSSKEDIEISGS